MSDLPPDVAARLVQSREEAIRAKREGVLLVRRVLRPEEEPRSYIGGLPHLREDLDWPVSTRTGLPLSFIAQIDLRELPRPAGVFFPAEGLLWFFADFSQDQFSRDSHTRVLFDSHPRTLARVREAPANLPTLNQYSHGWVKARHPRAFVEPKTGLFLHLVDTFYDLPYRRPTTWADFFRLWFTPKAEREEEFNELQYFGPGVYGGMIDQLREEAVRRAAGVGRTGEAYWRTYRGGRSGYGETHWPATSVDAEYALMSLGDDFRFSTSLKGGHPCPLEVVTDLAARVQAQIETLRSLGPRALAPPERVAINAIVDEVRKGFTRVDYQRRQVMSTGIRDWVQWTRSTVSHRIAWTYPHTAFEILRTMPDAEKYVPAEMLHPYQELMLGGQFFFHQMFGHGSSSQDAPATYEDAGYVLLLQIGASATLGLPLQGDAVMHYWIPRRDLARGRFDRVEGTWEAG